MDYFLYQYQYFLIQSFELFSLELHLIKFVTTKNKAFILCFFNISSEKIFCDL